MKSFTIKKITGRREYVNSELIKTPFIDNEFIEGIEGMNLSKKELLTFTQGITNYYEAFEIIKRQR